MVLQTRSDEMTTSAKSVPFISRGDRSGTNMAEIELWKDAGIDIAEG
jgi:tungstate transport system substrate-binding protein